MKGEVHKLKVDTGDELLTCISCAAARMKKREAQLRRTAKCIELDGGIFEHLS